jgi:hypothetical protein
MRHIWIRGCCLHTNDAKAFDLIVKTARVQRVGSKAAILFRDWPVCLQEPNGHYDLQLADPYDRAVAVALINLACVHKRARYERACASSCARARACAVLGCRYDLDGEQFKNEKMNGKPFQLPEEVRKKNHRIV